MAICTDATIGSANDRITVVGNLQIEGFRKIESEVVGIICHPLPFYIGAGLAEPGSVIEHHGPVISVLIIRQNRHLAPRRRE